MKQITVLAARSIDALEAKGADVEELHYETLVEARKRAKYLLTDTYRQRSEASERLGYSRVILNGEVINDYFDEVI